MIDLTGKTALITGGSRGIGAACVRMFAGVGAQVAFTYFQNESLAQQLVSNLGVNVKAIPYKVDMSSEEDIISCIKKVKKDFGSIDILVNNAGIWKRNPVDEMNLKEWNETIQVNLNSTFLFASKVTPIMKEKNFGRIINISSTAGQRGEANYSHYAASKGAIISFTKSLASEFSGMNINVNCVAPGWVYTDMSNEVLLNPKMENNLKEYNPVGRAAYPDEIAGPVLFLASKLADHINGEILNVNGGSVLCG